MTTPVPAHMESTVALLRSAYPNGIPDEDRTALMAVMAETGMSNRSVASAFGYYYDEPYENFLHDASTCAVADSVSEHTKDRVRNHLRRFGFDSWGAQD